MTRAFRSWGFGACLCLTGASPCGQAAGIYTCVDAQGHRITADRPIPECQDREQKLLNPSGTVKATVRPPQTAQERQAEEAQQRRQEEEQARVAEDRRRERALLARYPNEQTLERERTESLQQVDDVTRLARSRIDELLVQRKSIAAEYEFYRKDPSKAPPALRQKMQDNQDAEQAQWRFVRDQEAEKQRISGRFDAELAHLRPLWAAAASAAQPAAGAAGGGATGAGR